MTPPEEPLLTELNARRLGPVRRFFVRHPVVMDVVVMLWFGLPGLATVLFMATPLRTDRALVPTALHGWIALAGIVLGVAALYLRRKRPIEVLVAVTALGVAMLATTGVTQGFELAFALALYAVAASRPPGVTWLAFAASTLAMCLAVWVWDVSTPVAAPESAIAPVTDAQVRWASIVLITIGALLAVAIGTSARNRRLHIADLVARTNALARDRDQQAQLARAAERSRIAREMHDVVAHSLSVMIALADGARASLAKKPDRSRVALEELASTGRTALADMRRVLGVLEEPRTDFEPQPDARDLVELVDRFRAAGLPVTTRGLRTPLPEDTGLQLAVFRIVQESLTNTLRYAPTTTRVHVEIGATRKGIEVTVTDEGGGTGVVGTSTGGTGRGVIGMRERVGVYGGVVEAGPWGSGWRVHAELPWAGRDHARTRPAETSPEADFDDGAPADVTDWAAPGGWDPRRNR